MILVRDAANTLAQRNGTNAQQFNIYNTFTSATDYERLEAVWGSKTGQFEALVKNVSVDYLVMDVQMAIGLVMLPFNISRLGQSEYGLWVLATSITMYFSVLDFGYGVAQVKFASHRLRLLSFPRHEDRRC